MRRRSVPVLLAAVALLGLLAAGGRLAASAQQATPAVSPAATAGHPLVGAWVVDTSAEAAGQPQEATIPPDVTVFTDEGSVIDASGAGEPGVGSWEATGPRTAALTFVLPIQEEDFAGTVVIRATVEVDATGETFAGPYSYTVVAADGTVVDAGRDMARGTRIPVEPVEAGGTPLAAVPTWTPATPAPGTPPA
jgi:hypothetical protein